MLQNESAEATRFRCSYHIVFNITCNLSLVLPHLFNNTNTRANDIDNGVQTQTKTAYGHKMVYGPHTKNKW